MTTSSKTLALVSALVLAAVGWTVAKTSCEVAGTQARSKSRQMPKPRVETPSLSAVSERPRDADAPRLPAIPAARALPQALGGSESNAGTNAEDVALGVECAHEQSERCPHLSPSRAQLAEMARCATIQYDVPYGVLTDAPIDAKQALGGELGLSAEQEQKVRAASERFRQEVKQELLSIADSAGIPRSDVQDASPDALIKTLRSTLGEREIDARRRAARTRAGLEEPRPARTPEARLVELMVGLGDRYQSRLADEVGSELASELRAADDGWPSKTLLGSRCEENAPDP